MAFLGGQFKSATHGQFKSAQGGQFDRILQISECISCILSLFDFGLIVQHIDYYWCPLLMFVENQKAIVLCCTQMPEELHFGNSCFFLQYSRLS